MPNFEMIPDDQSSTLMETDMFTTVSVLMSTTDFPLNDTDSRPEEMVFNAGHRLSIIVYRSVAKQISLNTVTLNQPDFHFLALFSEIFAILSILFVLSAFGNITVLTLLIKRRLRTKSSRLDFMLTHLAIADLMVSRCFFCKSNLILDLTFSSNVF